MAEVTYLGMGPLEFPPSSVLPPNDVAEFLTGNYVSQAAVQYEGPVLPPFDRIFFQAVLEGGEDVGIVFNVGDPDVEIGVTFIEGDDASFYLGGLYPPQSITPSSPGIRQGPFFPQALPAMSTTELYLPIGTLAQMYQFLDGLLPGTPQFSAALLETTTPIPANAQITFLASLTVNPSLRGNTYLVSAYVPNATNRDTIVLNVGTPLPVTPGTSDRYILEGRAPTRLTPVLEIILA